MKIKTDSRKIKKGDIFVALNNFNDGGKYVIDAIKNGASKVVVSEGIYDVETIITTDTKQYLIKFLKSKYYNKIKGIKLIGVTGTNGKTTTAFLIYEALNKANIKCGYIGTNGFYLDKKIKNLNNTTPDILELYELLLEAKRNGCQYMTIEASSHALDQRRLGGLLFDIVIFTNLTLEHQNYHKTMENYAIAKQKLFNMVKKDGFTIVNIDDEYKKYFLKQNSITYGFKDSDNRIISYESYLYGTTFRINDQEYKTKLIGKYNIYNLVAVISCLKILKIQNIFDIIKELDVPSGRMEKIIYKKNLIIIDYAHTPDGTQKVLEAVNEIKQKKLYVIVGCGGGENKDKRSLIGEIVTNMADYVIFTNDNPRDEDELNIINDIIQNVDKKNYEIIINRKKAIEKGIQMLKKNDILIVLGKGHESFQVIKGKKILFNDKETVLDIIRR